VSSSIATFAGAGELDAALREQIAAAGLEQEIELRGVVQHEQIVRELNGACYDIAVLASTEKPGEHEGIPVALMEAMAAAVPCVTTDTGSNKRTDRRDLRHIGPPTGSNRPSGRHRITRERTGKTPAAGASCACSRAGCLRNEADHHGIVAAARLQFAHADVRLTPAQRSLSGRS